MRAGFIMQTWKQNPMRAKNETRKPTAKPNGKGRGAGALAGANANGGTGRKTQPTAAGGRGAGRYSPKPKADAPQGEPQKNVATFANEHRARKYAAEIAATCRAQGFRAVVAVRRDTLTRKTIALEVCNG